MNDTRITVSLKDREIILVGTAHVSRESIEEVSRIIRENQPDMVCVELDAGRYKAITDKDHWEALDLAKVFKEGKGFLLIANLVLSSFQRRMGVKIGVKPGEEMKIAIDTAQELGIPYALCDREVQLTLRRAWTRCGLWSKCKLLASLLSSAFSSEKLSEEEIENLKKRNELEGMMTELAEYLPEVKETLIDERDRYLAAKIWTSGTGQTGAVKKQVAVVGAGHLPGIKACLEKIASGETGEDVSALDTIPAAKGFAKMIGWIVPALIVLLIAIGFVKVGPEMSMAMLLRWVLLNGSLAALGALIALAHPLAILVSFIGAPIGTISPFIAVGFFSGLTEVSLRKPRVSDTETISDDVMSIRGIYRNRITKALLVFFLSSFGGAVGNMLSIPSLAGLLF
ncbi:MAG: TraB/GumN family protein [Spirochaetaceae bacterium]|jgi:pheromone shutdown-related protein TraB|nr:TraB/GumN family protein [Spirochaetaceae bacterium]